MKIEIVLRSHVDKGQITINGLSQSLSVNDYHHQFESKTGRGTVIATLSDMPPGIRKGIELVSFKTDGRELMDIQHLKLEDFCVFEMRGNPHVTNETIAERNIVFNGDLVSSVNLDKVLWFPWHYSDEPTGFVYSNNHTACVNDDGCYHGEPMEHRDLWSNLPFHGKDLTRLTKVALGCSVTYGTGVSKSRTWPTLLGFANMGVPAAGIDAIYHNLETLLRQGASPEQVIILFPSLERRLATFQQDGLYFRIPVLATQFNSMDIMKKNYFWSRQDRNESLLDATLGEIVADTGSSYSKVYLEKISKLPLKISVSSWSRETYSILSKCFDHVLPFFEILDDANDHPPHPGPLSHQKWAEKVQELL
jgi:hypothetical protein